MNINEIFDTDLGIKPEEWKENGKFLLFSFEVNNQKYTIQLARHPLYGIKNAVEISFFLTNAEDEEIAFSTAHNQDRPLSVYGIVINAVIPVLIKYDFDAIYFQAERRHSDNEKEWEQKKIIYSSLAVRIKGNKYRKYVRDHTGPETEWLLSKIPPKIGSFITAEQLSLNNAKRVFG